MTVRYNVSENSIDDSEHFRQYCSWFLSWNKGNKLHTTATKVSTAQLNGVSNSHVFTDVIMFTYIRPVKCNVQVINGSTASETGFGLVVIKIPKTNIVIPLWPSYSMPQNPQNIINQNALNYYNQFMSVRTEAIRCVQITTDIVIKLKSEKKSKKDINNYWTSLTLMYLRLDRNILQVRT